MTDNHIVQGSIDKEAGCGWELADKDDRRATNSQVVCGFALSIRRVRCR